MDEQPGDDAGEDLSKVRKYRKIYYIAGFGLLGLGVIFFILAAVRWELPALLMGIVAVVWWGILYRQAIKSRELEELILARTMRDEEMKELAELERQRAKRAAADGETGDEPG